MPDGFIVDSTYRAEDGKTKVYLFGRLKSGKNFMTVNVQRPYFFVPKEASEKTTEILAEKELDSVWELEETNLKNFNEEQLVKLVGANPKDVPSLRQALLDQGISCYEADIPFVTRFLLDRDLHGTINIDGESIAGSEYGENFTHIDHVFVEPTITPCDYTPELRVLSFDLETSHDDERIFAISLYSRYTDDNDDDGGKEKTFSKVLLLNDGTETYNGATNYADEELLLWGFLEEVQKFDPDVLTGWNVIDFDFVHLKKRMDKYKIPYKLGRTGWTSYLRVSDSFFTDSKVHCDGRAVLDGLQLLRGSFIKLDDYKLNTAAHALLGAEKLITKTGKAKYQEIEDAYKHDKQKLVDYNLLDSKLVFDILEKEDLISLTIQRSKLSRMMLDRVNASIASFDSLYIYELNNAGYAAPIANPQEREERITGGYVRSSIPGIYKNLLVFDFKSLYPSIMRTFNIDPLQFVGYNKKMFFDADKEKNPSDKKLYVHAPNGAIFRNNDKGILPSMLATLWAQRDKAKKEKNMLASNAIKILMNSCFGVMANPTFRFYSLPMANAITHFGQHLIKYIADVIESKGYRVIYGDTDSIFVDVDEENYDKANALGKQLERDMNEHMNKYIKDEYQRQSIMEIEYEKIYIKMMMPHVRGSDTGSKKRYAGLLKKGDTEEIDIVGLEFVRRDWTDAAKEFQKTLLDLIFHDSAEDKIVTYVSQFVDDLKAGKIDEKLVYRKAIRKSLSSYTKTTPPHIKAARKIPDFDPHKANIIDYYITVDGPEAVEYRQNDIDYEHYINKQLRPIADTILSFYKKKFDDVLVGHSQKSLFDFK